MTEIDIRREDGETGGRWVAIVDGHEAQAVYSRVNDQLVIIDHTDVPDALRGRSVGKALISRAVEDARAESFQVIPLCPFAKALFDKTPDWADVRKGA
ncbi:MAG: GNAT family N-acetyltransferase [Maricaulaceae bacterium]|jgi:predicted GNAT family acetyltransferase